MLYLQNYNIILNKGNMSLLFVIRVPTARYLKRKVCDIIYKVYMLQISAKSVILSLNGKSPRA